MNKFITIVLIAFVSLQCNNEKETKMKENHDHKHTQIDDHTYANPKKAKITHLDLEIESDFEHQIIKGKASYKIENHQSKEIILDSKDLLISKVTIGASEKETSFSFGQEDPVHGKALKIAIEPTTSLITVYYATKPNGSEALQFLNPQQTADKKHPFLFTQGQAILTRTWIPIQDSPGIRITYNAKVTVPKDLMAVMSASNPKEKSADGVYHFEMKQAISPYLIALAVGDLEYQSLGRNTGVYAEKSMIKNYAAEFVDMQAMVDAAENLYGPYVWEQFDVIVLPPSFPFGGMENPRLTFATPTIIAGDQSLVSLVAHELAHSWSGNLVTNATWDDFWLNEGFTVYFERRIMEAVEGTEYAEMLAELGFQDLQGSIKSLDKKDTHLKLNLKGRNPDDGMTDIAYEKGYFLLRTIEKSVGKPKFDAFLKEYFTKNAFTTLTTEDFIKYIQKHLFDKENINFNLDEWIYQPGLPQNIALVNSNKFVVVESAFKAFKNDKMTAKEICSRNWTTHEWLHFIRLFPSKGFENKMAKIDQFCNFTHSGNSEIAAIWFQKGIPNSYKTIDVPLEKFLITVGRRKFLTPLYSALKDNNQLETARIIYQKARPNYH